MWELYSAVLGRQALSERSRQAFGVYLDEPKLLARLPVPLDSMFELFRGMGVGLTMTAQSVSQLPKPLASAALSNAATVAVFRQHADADAKLLARELQAVSSDQLKALDPYHLVLRLGLGAGVIAEPVTGTTLVLPTATGKADALRRRSAGRYGRSIEEVDATLAVRHGREPLAPVGDRQEEDNESAPAFGRRSAS
jgi:hypothetical protein